MDSLRILVKIVYRITKVNNAMNLKIIIVSLCFLSMYTLLSCSQKTEIKTIETKEEVTQTNFDKKEIDKTINEFAKKYNAVDFALTKDMFSVDIVDIYKGKNLFAEVYYIDDVFYIEDDMYMYSEQMYIDDYHLLLKVTPEQYAKIKSFGKVTNPDDYLIYFNSTIGAVFSFDSIEIKFSELNAWFGFNLDTNSTIADYDLYDSYATKVIKGTLIDIVEIKN